MAPAVFAKFFPLSQHMYMATTHITKCCSVIWTSAGHLQGHSKKVAACPAAWNKESKCTNQSVLFVIPQHSKPSCIKSTTSLRSSSNRRIGGRVVPLQRANQICLNLFLILNAITIIRLTGIPRLTRSSALANAYPIAAISSTMTRNITAKYCTTA